MHYVFRHTNQLRIKNFLIILFLSVAHISIAQMVNIDSLKQVVAEGKADTNTVIAYRMICGTLSYSSPREAIPYGWKGVELGKKINWDKGIAGCFLNLGNAYVNLASYDTSLMVLDSALVYSLKAGDPNRIALVYINRSATYINLNYLNKAMEDAMSALPYAEASKNSDRMARVYMTLGNISFYQEKWEKAISYYRECLLLFAENNVVNMIGTCNMNIANCFKNMGRPDTAINYILPAIEMFKEVDDNERLTLAYGASSNIYYELGNYKESEKYARLAINVAKETDDREMIIENTHSLGAVYIRQKKYKEAEAVLIPALAEAKKHAYLAQMFNINKSLAELYHAIGRDDEAYNYLNAFIAVSDTIKSRRQNEELMNLQTQYETAQKEKENELLKSESALQKAKIARKNLMNYLLAGGFVFLTLTGFILWNRTRLKQKLNEVQLRNKIASDLHDDIGATLSGIKMFSELVHQKVKQTNPDAIPLLEKISDSSKEMIDSMSDIVWMIKPGNDKFSNLDDRMTNFAYEVCTAKNIELHFYKDEKLDSIFLPMEMRRDIYLIFKEAVNNAVKYSGADKIEVHISADNSIFKMVIIDNGRGFDPITNKKGNGLDNMQRRTEMHKGTFGLHSKSGGGTQISIFIPIP